MLLFNIGNSTEVEISASAGMKGSSMIIDNGIHWARVQTKEDRATSFEAIAEPWNNPPSGFILDCGDEHYRLINVVGIEARR